MPEADVVFHRLAAREFRSARDWYAERSPSVAERFRDAVAGSVERIAVDYESLPYMGRAYRWIRVKRFPYILITRVREDASIMIVAVAHTSRRARYWRHRR
jgi:plasmid stabilization system protein ParE